MVVSGINKIYVRNIYHALHAGHRVENERRESKPRELPIQEAVMHK